eukprot:scaffold44059_cov19-Tisochrysis_lutea.AAC.8
MDDIVCSKDIEPVVFAAPFPAHRVHKATQILLPPMPCTYKLLLSVSSLGVPSLPVRRATDPAALRALSRHTRLGVLTQTAFAAALDWHAVMLFRCLLSIPSCTS